VIRKTPVDVYDLTYTYDPFSQITAVAAQVQDEKSDFDCRNPLRVRPAQVSEVQDRISCSGTLWIVGKACALLLSIWE
jgi:hypothetical protein